MGNYNPYVPQILGQEWVPIRDESLVLNPFANSLERGYTFTLATATAVNAVRFYLKDWPTSFGSSMIYTASVYPQGQEAASGPVRSVIIPTSSVVITGSGLTPVNSSGATQDLFANGDNEFIYWILGNGATGFPGMSIFFAVNSFAPLLLNKRILGVDLLVGINVVSQGTEVDDINQAINTYIANDTWDPINVTDTFRLPDLITNKTPASTIGTVRMHLGDANRFYGVGSGSTAGVRQIMQWTYPELARFEASAANRLRVILTEGSSPAANLGPEVQIEYAALEVFYCEESRVLMGSRIFNDDIPNRPLRDPFTLGMNSITVRNPTTLSEAGSLAAGNYTVTISESNMGDNYYASVYRTTAKLNEVRQLYQIPSHPGVQVNLPFPLNENTIGQTFTEESTDLIPQLTMALSTGAVVDASHVYGQQSVAQVYGTIFASQEIDDRYAGGSRIWPWVRYYARRFGNTTTPLKLTGYAPAQGMVLNGVAGTYASTPDNAVLDIVGDIDLRITLTLADWTPPATSALIAKWGVAGQRSYLLNLTTTGLLELAWSADGTTTIVKDSTAALPIDQGQLTVRATLDVNNGAAGNDVTFYYGPTLDGPWTQLGSTVTTAGVTSIFSGNLAVEIGSQSVGTVSLLTGIVHNAQIHNGINTAPVATPHFDTQPLGTTSFVDSAGLTWTLNGSAYIAGGITNSSVQITPAEFDALDEITDGWKEISLLFSTPPTMGVINPIVQPTWRWTATGETAGNRWEVLGATAPGVSGFSFLTSNTVPLNQVPLTQRLYTGTYGYPVSGAVINEDWMPQWGPYVSGATPDQASDAVIMFAQYMPTVTGFGVTVTSQAITGIGQNCGIDPCGIPNRILYNRLTWGRFPNTGYALDTFTRTVSNGMGSADIGGAYTITATAAEYAVNGTKGVITPAVASIATSATLASIGPDVDITVTIANNGAITSGTSARGSAVGRFTDANNFYQGLVQTTEITGVTLVGIQKTVAGVETVLGTGAIVPTINNSNQVKLRFLVQGQQLKAKAWSIYTEEPVGWNVEVVDTSLTTGSRAGISARSGGNVGNSLLFDDLTIGAPSYWFGYYELQRMDQLTEWATIMKATSPDVTGFNDFEARTDMLSSYRIRAVDIYDFPGQWSSTVSVSLISPGVSGSCLSDAHVMIFTTNERQDGSSNLAYSNAWESQVSEDFSFAEAGFTQLQPMYDRDFFTAFRPTERGGDQFSRTVLVQAAAISPATLPGFRALSDMAWDDVSYICVRDEDGNRWFANVNVPAGTVQNRRRLYMATVQIVEVTDTPSPVDP